MQVYVEQSFILFVLSGRRIYHWQGRSWELKQGTCAFVKPGAVIAERANAEEWCVMVFFVPDDFLLQVVKENQNLFPDRSFSTGEYNEPLIMLGVSEISHACFSSMLPYFTLSPSPPENLVELKFKELVLSLLINPANTYLVSYLNALNNKNQVSLKQVMHNNFSFHLGHQQQNDAKRKAVIKITKLTLEETITILDNGPKTKERIMALEVERRIINKINRMPWYLSLLRSASMAFDPGGNLFPGV